MGAIFGVLTPKKDFFDKLDPRCKAGIFLCSESVPAYGNTKFTIQHSLEIFLMHCAKSLYVLYMQKVEKKKNY